MKNNNEEKHHDWKSNPEKSFEAGKKGGKESTDVTNQSSSSINSSNSSGSSTSMGSSSKVPQPQHQRGPGSNMYPSSQNLSESGKKEGEPRSENRATKAKNNTQEGKGWTIDGKDHVET